MDWVSAIAQGAGLLAPTLARCQGNSFLISGTGLGDVSRKRAQPLGPHRQRYTAQQGCEFPSRLSRATAVRGRPGRLDLLLVIQRFVEPYVTVGSRGVASRRGDWKMPCRRFAARSANKPSTNPKPDGGDSHSSQYRFNFRSVYANRSPNSTGSAQAEPARAKT